MSSNKYNLDDARNIFFIESREMLEKMENCLLTLEKDISNTEVIPELFRTMHTIKGSAGMFGFEKIEKFAHALENILDKVRNNEFEIDPDLITTLFDCHDLLILLLDKFETGEEEKEDKDFNQKFLALKIKLDNILSGTVPNPESQKPEEIKTIEPQSGSQNVLNECWHISIRFNQDIFTNGLDPHSAIKYLDSLGEIKSLVKSNSFPTTKKMDPTKCYLGFEISFFSKATKDEIEEIFSFFVDDSTLRILPPSTSIDEYLKLLDGLPEENMTIGQMLMEVGSLTQSELDKIEKLQEKGESKFFGEIAVDENMVQQPLVEAALQKQSQIRSNENISDLFVRISISKLEKLIGLVGETVTSNAHLEKLVESSENQELIETVSDMSQLVNEIRDSSMSLRMVPIGDTLKKYERMVRDLSKAEGKKVELIINGGETELDKTLVQKVSDPLMHLIRNAVDHGIEKTEVREKMGKSPEGILMINARHETGTIIIEIIDDGHGLDLNKIINSAIKKGLMKPGDEKKLSTNEIYQFIFYAGFTTTDKVTNLSGRGVGMDVVKRNIEMLRGNVVIKSEKDKGTTVRIQLPLTLAIIDGFLVKAGKLSCVFPLDMVHECMDFPKDYRINQTTSNFYTLRNEMIPYLRLRDFFNDNSEETKRENIIIINHMGKKIGFVVDTSLGEIQAVVKPIGHVFNKLQWISGATILGDGDVALILDIPMLINYLQAKTRKKAV